MKNDCFRERDRDRPYRAIYEYNGYRGTLIELAEHYKIKLSTFRTRVSLGWDIAEAIEQGIDDRKKRESDKNV